MPPVYHTSPLLRKPRFCRHAGTIIRLFLSPMRVINLPMKQRFPEYPELLQLPPASEWTEPAHVAAYARACMEACGLGDWSFEWDRAIRRLGCCKMTRRTLSLSRYYVEAYLARDCRMIRTTILHEVAHALAWVKNGERGHGAAWRYWCAALGIAGEKSGCKCEDFTPDHLRRRPMFALCHDETHEVFRLYFRKPSISPRKLKNCYIPGKKEATLGHLCIVPVNHEADSGSDLPGL